ncbi:hypothetical protein CANINC_002023 [Pichia inconspicua]|uniref:VPS28 C-terminal domain-containing protein n=1 Tax=Pichia inconspicua TaxID=52247 RepID=A0A4T0X2N8_9ASCO|nr:hypothetical protein CANINC_002023 [[Candida] inconspicua]
MSDKAELYSILYSLATLERAFMHGSLEPSQKLEYASLCDDLLEQYHSLTATMDSTDPLSILTFANNDDITFFKLALRRIKAGVNGCTEHNHIKQINPDNNNNANKKIIAEATAAFITLLDAIKLGYNTRDSLHPLLANTLKSAGKVIVNNDFKGRSNLVQWLIRINKMSITETLEEGDLKLLLDDVDSAYSGFFEEL